MTLRLPRALSDCASTARKRIATKLLRRLISIGVSARILGRDEKRIIFGRSWVVLPLIVVHAAVLAVVATLSLTELLLTSSLGPRSLAC